MALGFFFPHEGLGFSFYDKRVIHIHITVQIQTLSFTYSVSDLNWTSEVYLVRVNRLHKKQDFITVSVFSWVQGS